MNDQITARKRYTFECSCCGRSHDRVFNGNLGNDWFDFFCENCNTTTAHFASGSSIVTKEPFRFDHSLRIKISIAVLKETQNRLNDSFFYFVQQNAKTADDLILLGRALCCVNGVFDDAEGDLLAKEEEYES